METTKEQLAAIKDITNPCLIIAGAGSGKTHTIVEKFHYLIDNGYHVNKILVSTFSKKAAEELMERISREINLPADEIKFCSTLHSLAFRIIRQNYHILGYENSPNVLKTWEIKNYLKKNFRNYDKFDEAYKIIKLDLNHIKGFNHELIEFKKMQESYCEWMKENNAIDFHHMVKFSVEILNKDKIIRDSYKNYFEHIIIDEFQDIDYDQYDMIKLLARENNITVVGDDDQTIYTFRGSAPDIFIKFADDFKAKKYFLTKNYRSTKNILELSNKLIHGNKNRLEKKLVSNKGCGETPIAKITENPECEAEYVADLIQEFDQKTNLTMAVLYRCNFQSTYIEKALLKRRIPFANKSVSFYNQSEIKNLILYMKAIHTKDNKYVKEILNIPNRYLSKRTFFNKDILTTDVNELKINESQKSNLERFRYFINHLNPKHFENLEELVGEIISEIDYYEHLENDENFDEKCENVEEFKEQLSGFKSISEFINHLNLFKSSNQNAIVTLSTIHQSKGLEWDVVFLIGVNEKFLPHLKSKIEEERRLCYVAMTRAKEKLFLTASRKAMKGYEIILSRFLNEIR